MDEKKIIEQHKIKINNLKEFNNYYYNNDNPKISDQEYDALKTKILNLEKNSPFKKIQ